MNILLKNSALISFLCFTLPLCGMRQAVLNQLYTDTVQSGKPLGSLSVDILQAYYEFFDKIPERKRNSTLFMLKEQLVNALAKKPSLSSIWMGEIEKSRQLQNLQMKEDTDAKYAWNNFLNSLDIKFTPTGEAVLTGESLSLIPTFKTKLMEAGVTEQQIEEEIKKAIKKKVLEAQEKSL